MDSADANTKAQFVLRDGQVELMIDLRVYRLSAIQKSSYRFAASCTAVLGEIRGDALPVTLLFPKPIDEETAAQTVRLFFRELLDQELREKIGAETSQLRVLLLAHAFSRSGLAPGS